MYVLSWRTISALTRVLFRYLFKKTLTPKNDPLVSAKTIGHSSTYIILYVFCLALIIDFPVSVEIKSSSPSII